METVRIKGPLAFVDILAAGLLFFWADLLLLQQWNIIAKPPFFHCVFIFYQATLHQHLVHTVVFRIKYAIYVVICNFLNRTFEFMIN